MFSFQEYVDLVALEPQTPTLSQARPSPRNYVGTAEHDTESEDRDNDNVFLDNTDDIWEFRKHELPVHVRRSESGLDTRKLWLQNREQIDVKRLRHKSSPDKYENKKQPRVVVYRSPIQSDV